MFGVRVSSSTNCDFSSSSPAPRLKVYRFVKSMKTGFGDLGLEGWQFRVLFGLLVQHLGFRGLGLRIGVRLSAAYM